MKAMAMSSMSSAAANDAALRSQIAQLRESLKSQRDRAQQLWDACAAEVSTEAGESRLALGRYTEKLLNRQTDEVYS